MSKKDSVSSLFSGIDFSEFAKRCQTLPCDFGGLLEIQRKNVESITKVQKLALENMQDIASRQNEVFSQIMAQSTKMANDLLREGKPEDKLARNTKVVQANYEQAFSSVKEIAEMIKQANSEASKILRARAAENLKDLQAQSQSQKKAAEA